MTDRELMFKALEALEWASDRLDPIGDQCSCPLCSAEIALGLRLAREEGVFCGTSTGANVVASLRLAQRLDSRATIVTLMCDTGMKYLRSFGDKLG